MTIQDFKQIQIGVVVATCDRPKLLSERSIPSILNQSRAPDFIVIVDDSSSAENIKKNNDYIKSLRLQKTTVKIIRNIRTTGACGSWNTGIEWIFTQAISPKNTYVAILDDDDAWKAEYLETCIEHCKSGNYDMVATGIERYDSKDKQPVIYPSPSSLIAEDFLVGNGGIQGSNIFIRLSIMLMAGCFDESLRSSTDRDLCIRIADLGIVNYSHIESNLVEHYAELYRLRLTSKGSENKLAGLTVFWQKYRARMSSTQQTQFKVRAEKLFSWKQHAEPISEIKQNTSLNSYKLDWTTPEPPFRPQVTLYIGVITSEPETVWPLLQSIDKQNLNAQIIILNNGCSEIELNQLLTKINRLSLRVKIIDESQQKIDSENGVFGKTYKKRPIGQVGIAQARTMIQRYIGRELSADRDSIGCILDDDMRIDERAKSFISWLPFYREKGFDVILGAYEGASPNPPINGLRVALVDLVHNLYWLNNISHEQQLPDRRIENILARTNCPDYYYDLSRKHTSHLEQPHWIEKIIHGETVLQAKNRLLQGSVGLISGNPLTRPLVVVPPQNPLIELKDSVNRGGITFILNSDALTQTPNCVLYIGDQEARRSDMIWAIINKFYRGFVIKSVGFPISHIARKSTPKGLNIAKVNAEIIGSTMYSSLMEFLKKHPCHNLDFSDNDVTEIENLFQHNLSKRMIRLEMSFHRIRGLHQTLKNNFNEPILSELLDLLEKLFSKEMWLKLNREVFSNNTTKIEVFLKQLRGVSDDYAISDLKHSVRKFKQN